MKWIKRIFKLAIAIFILLLIADLALVLGLAHFRRDIKKADAVIILGAAINTPALYSRTIEGLHLYQDGKADRLVLSGGKIADADISEAQYMEKVLKANSSQLPEYIMEEQSHNTYDNIKFSREKLGDKVTVIIVSDEFHLARAVLMAKREGFDEVYWSAPEPSYYSAAELRFYYFREFMAMLSYIPKFISG